MCCYFRVLAMSGAPLALELARPPASPSDSEDDPLLQDSSSTRKEASNWLLRFSFAVGSVALAFVRFALPRCAGAAVAGAAVAGAATAVAGAAAAGAAADALRSELACAAAGFR